MVNWTPGFRARARDRHEDRKMYEKLNVDYDVPRRSLLKALRLAILGDVFRRRVFENNVPANIFLGPYKRRMWNELKLPKTTATS